MNHSLPVTPESVPEAEPAGQLELGQAVEVYREAYLARLTEALGDTFESVWTVLGDKKFYQISEEYILNFGSNSYNLGDFGEQFWDLLAKHHLSKPFPFLVDLARLEWCYKEVFHREDSVDVGVPKSNLGEGSEEFLGESGVLQDQTGFAIDFSRGDFGLLFHQDHEILKFEFDVVAIWDAVKEERELQNLDPASKYVLIHKKGGQVYFSDVDEFSYLFWLGFKKGESFFEIVEGLSDHPGLSPEIVKSVFEVYSKYSLIKGMRD
jgi:hypothetical protein